VLHPASSLKPSHINGPRLDPERMLKKPPFSPAHPRRAKTRRDRGRPQQVRRRGVRLWYVEPASVATCLSEAASAEAGNDAGGFFSIHSVVGRFEVAGRTILPGNRRLPGLFDETAQTRFGRSQQFGLTTLNNGG